VRCLHVRALPSHTHPGSSGCVRLLLQTCTRISYLMAQSLQESRESMEASRLSVMVAARVISLRFPGCSMDSGDRLIA
jgi:hypothetical protein